VERYVFVTAQLESRLFFGTALGFVVLGGSGLERLDELAFVLPGALCSVLALHSAADVFVYRWVHPGRELQSGAIKCPTSENMLPGLRIELACYGPTVGGLLCHPKEKHDSSSCSNTALTLSLRDEDSQSSLFHMLPGASSGLRF
jgi:hypothetical protein